MKDLRYIQPVVLCGLDVDPKFKRKNCHLQDRNLNTDQILDYVVWYCDKTNKYLVSVPSSWHRAPKTIVIS